MFAELHRGVPLRSGTPLVRFGLGTRPRMHRSAFRRTPSRRAREPSRFSPHLVPKYAMGSGRPHPVHPSGSDALLAEAGRRSPWARPWAPKRSRPGGMSGRRLRPTYCAFQRSGTRCSCGSGLSMGSGPKPRTVPAAIRFHGGCRRRGTRQMRRRPPWTFAVLRCRPFGTAVASPSLGPGRRPLALARPSSSLPRRGVNLAASFHEPRYLPPVLPRRGRALGLGPSSVASGRGTAHFARGELRSSLR